MQRDLTAIRAAMLHAHDVLHSARAMLPESDLGHAEIGEAMRGLREAAALASAPAAEPVSPMAKMAQALRDKAAAEKASFDARVQSGEWGPAPEAGTEADCQPEHVAQVEGDAAVRILRWNKNVGAFDYPVGTKLYAASAALASAPAAEAEFPVSRDRLQDALSEYWDAAYQEGKEGRDHDTKDGRAQKAFGRVMQIYRAAQNSDVQAQRASLSPDALADKCEAWLQAGGASSVVDAYEAGYRACEGGA